MKTKPLTVQIPQPNEDGYCSDDCILNHKDDYRECPYSHDVLWIPSKSCPWYEEIQR